MNMRILLTGIPGTGKTTMGNYLAEQHAFVHYDREAFRSWKLYEQVLWKRSLRLFVSSAELRNPRIVISWGFLPGKDNLVIHGLIALQFFMCWFDGDRAHARQVFINRGNASLEMHDEQINRINRLDLGSYPHITIDPFTKDKKFKPEEEIAQIILTSHLPVLPKE